ncbi:hypothetical protein ACDZ28_11040 [Paenibacillus sp. RS8]|uniref:hypothetical protein n=1 Tax=Paenibacillus sp. RS8 TaxID=3242681 RepID=UPI0035C13444
MAILIVASLMCGMCRVREAERISLNVLRRLGGYYGWMECKCSVDVNAQLGATAGWKRMLGGCY